MLAGERRVQKVQRARVAVIICRAYDAAERGRADLKGRGISNMVYGTPGRAIQRRLRGPLERLWTGSKTHSREREAKDVQAGARCAGTAGILATGGARVEEAGRNSCLACFKTHGARKRDGGHRVGHDGEGGELDEGGESELHSVGQTRSGQVGVSEQAKEGSTR